MSRDASLQKKMPLRHIIIAAAAALVMLAADYVSKELIIRNFELFERVNVIPNFFDITFVTNPGCAWGMFAGRKIFLLSISAAAFIASVVFFKKLCCGYAERCYAVFLIVSGIFGNCIDRIFRGEVVDFLDFYISKYHWPAFNVADSCITAGVAIFIISHFVRPEEKKENDK